MHTVFLCAQDHILGSIHTKEFKFGNQNIWKLKFENNQCPSPYKHMYEKSFYITEYLHLYTYRDAETGQELWIEDLFGTKFEDGLVCKIITLKF